MSAPRFHRWVLLVAFAACRANPQSGGSVDDVIDSSVAEELAPRVTLIGDGVSNETEKTADCEANSDMAGTFRCEWSVLDDGSYEFRSAGVMIEAGAGVDTMVTAGTGNTLYGRACVIDAHGREGCSEQFTFATLRKATHFAGPVAQGAGDCSSEANRGTLATCVAQPSFTAGSTLELWAATSAVGSTRYTGTGASAVLSLPVGKKGTATNKIVIRCKYPLACAVDGQAVRRPLHLTNDNDHITIKDIIFKNSGDTGIEVCASCDDFLGQRLVVVNARPDQSIILVRGHNGILEDSAGWGTGNKCGDNAQADPAAPANNVEYRRVFCILQDGDLGNPSSVYNNAYNSNGARYQNVVAMWDETGEFPNYRYGMFSNGSRTKVAMGPCGDSKYLGGIGIIRSAFTASFMFGFAYGDRQHDCVEYRDMLLYVEGHTSLRPYFLSAYDHPDGAFPSDCVECNRRARDFTSIGFGAPGVVQSVVSGGTQQGYTTTNLQSYPTAAAATSAGASPFQTGAGAGARLCFRYERGQLTTTKLWPWPLDSNMLLADAMDATGLDSTRYLGPGRTFTSLIESIFGVIPSACRS